VVAEGGNLGLTQRARIEYARGGGRVNADFIDNSAGVSCSDHEVNLKILLGIAEAAGRLTRAERDPLLVEVTEDVTAHVLYGSFLQAQILSQEVEASSRRLDAYEDLMQTLEHERLIDRAIDALPSGEEMAERRHSGLGMTRPELAVLLAHAKRSLAGALLASPLPDDPYLQGLLRGYFPPAVVERFGDLLGEHPLRRELAATIAANEVVDSLGPTFASRLVGERGIGPADVVRAYLLARATTLAAERWAAVERLGRSLPRELAADLMAGADEVVEATARWYLLHAPAAGLDEVIAEERPAFVRLAGAIAELCPPAWRLARAEAELALVAQGVGEDLARAHVHRRELALAPDMAFVAQQAGLELDDVARAFLLLDERLRMAWLEAELDRLAATTRWQRWAVEAVRDDLLLARRELALGALAAEPGDVEAAVERLLATHAMAAARLESFLRSLEVEGADLAGLTLAVRQLRSLAA